MTTVHPKTPSPSAGHPPRGPYPDAARLAEAARLNLCLPCHLCGGHTPSRPPSPDCPACLGSGWLRPCLACAAAGVSVRRQLAQVCLVCDGRRYTAGSVPSPDDDMCSNDIRVWAALRGTRTGYGEFS